MKFDLDKLKKELVSELPGSTAHMQMAPLSRRQTEAFKVNDTTRKSGVLLLIYPVKNQFHTVFILRPTYKGVHSGQIAFPGGKEEEVDDTIVDTALRETEEEIGVSRKIITPIGSLSSLYIPPSNSLVTPSVGFVDSRPTFIPDPREVAAVLESPISHFFDEKNSGTKNIQLAQGLLKEVPYFDLNGHIIWGATAMMLSEFREIVKRL